RRPADHGGLAQADEQVRLDGPPGEDARGPVPSGRRGRLRTRGPELHWPPDIRLLGLHPLLGPKSEGRMGGQAQDGEEPLDASAPKRSRIGAGTTCINRSRINTRRSSRSCKATTRTMGSPVTSPVSRSSWMKRERSGDTGCRGAAAMARSPGRTSFAWSNVTVYP